ncbi:MAG: 5'-3' exonuclease [Patescibacteria group bacterium]
MNKFLIIDSMYLAYRSFYGYPNLTNSKGDPSGAFFGYAKTILQMVYKINPDYLVITRDLPEPTIRHEALEEYKANRKPMEDSMVSQLPLIDEFGSKVTKNFLAKSGYEADDIIYSIIQKYSNEKNEFYVFSGDRDLYQLFVMPNVSFVKEEKNFISMFTHNDFEQKYGLKPTQWVDYKALVGDGSDNFKGVPGIGPVSATKLLNSVGSLYNLFKEMNWKVSDFQPYPIPIDKVWLADKKNQPIIKKIEENKDALIQSYFLSKLIQCDLSAFEVSNEIKFENVLSLLENNSMQSLITYYHKNFGSNLIQEELF